MPEATDGLAAPFARMSPADAAAVVVDGWELEPLLVRRVDTERDDTFAVTLVGGDRLIVKVAHPDDDVHVLDLQCKAVAWALAADPAMPLARIVPDRSADQLRRVTGPDGRARLARVMAHLPGQPLRYRQAPPAHRFEVGRAAGRLSAALAGFTHLAADRSLAWDLQEPGAALRATRWVEDARVRAVVERVLTAHAEHVVPELRRTRQQVVHNDLNPDNVLVDPAGVRFVVGIVDFGDVVRTAVVADAAIAASYAAEATAASSDPWRGPLDVLRGFTSVRALTDLERSLVAGLVVTRLAQRVALHSWLAAEDPANAHYTARALAQTADALVHLDVSPPTPSNECELRNA